jgi:hypothetical protein
MSDRAAAWTAALAAHPALAAACARLLALGRHRAAVWTLPADLPPAALDALDALIGLPFRRDRRVQLGAWRTAVGDAAASAVIAAIAAATGTQPADPPGERAAAAAAVRTGCADLLLPPALAAILAAELADPRLGTRVRTMGPETWIAGRRLAYRCAAALLDPDAPLRDVSTWGAQLAGDSKALRRGRPLRRAVLDLVRLAVPELAEAPAAEVAGHVGLDPDGAAAAALCCGPLRLRLTDSDLAFPAELAAIGQPAALTAGLLALAVPDGPVRTVLTCENPAPFAALCAVDAELPTARAETLIVLTNGFPNRAVRRLLTALRALAPEHLHWGDSDLAGIRIARICAGDLDREPSFWRSEGPHRIPFDAEQAAAIRHDLALRPLAPGAEVLRGCLAAGGWCEQEAWQPTPFSRPVTPVDI